MPMPFTITYAKKCETDLEVICFQDFKHKIVQNLIREKGNLGIEGQSIAMDNEEPPATQSEDFTQDPTITPRPQMPAAEKRKNETPHVLLETLVQRDYVFRTRLRLFY